MSDNSTTIGGVAGYVVHVAGTATSYIPKAFLTTAEYSFIDAAMGSDESVASVGSLTAGNNYTKPPTVSGTGGGGTGFAGTTTLGAESAVHHTGAAGTGYTTGDHVTLTNGVVLSVTASAGAITAAAIVTAGSLTGTMATTAVAQASTTGGGSGATFDLTYGVVSVVVTAGGIDYTSVPTVVFTNASGDTTGSGAAGTAVLTSTGTDLEGYLQGQTWASTGQNAWTRFSGYVVVYDTAQDETVLAGADIVGAAGSTPTKAEYATLVAEINSLKHIVARNLGHGIQKK